VEAGLRSFNMKMPEEINRIITDRLSDLLYCPTKAAVSNLEHEGFRDFDCQIIQAGDVMQDAAMFYADRAVCPEDIENSLLESGFVLVTLHRAENTNDPQVLAQIVMALNEINEKKLPVLIPLHPRTRDKLQQFDIELTCHIVDPVGYLEMLFLLKHARVVMTDSGGLQKEAFFFSKPCVTMRPETEWIELVEHGYNRLAGNNRAAILEAFDVMSNQTVDATTNLYGGGTASEVVVDSLGD